MALTTEEVTTIPETEKETMFEVLDMMFNGISNQYSDNYKFFGSRLKNEAKSTCVWDSFEHEGKWGSDVEFMFYCNGKAFYVKGTYHYFEPSDEFKNEEWGWVDGYNWSCQFKDCTKDQYNKLVKNNNKYGERIGWGVEFVDKFDYPYDFTQNTQNFRFLRKL